MAAPASAAVAGQIAAYNAHPVTSTDALNAALTQYGVPEIRNTVSGLRTTVANTTNSLNNVDPSVTGRTQGSLVTEAQRERQVANERAPIAQELQGENTNLNTEQQALTEALGQAQTTASNRVNDYLSKGKALQQEYENEYTREQAAAAAAEQKREFNVSSAQSQQRLDRTGGGRGGGGSGGSSSSKRTPTASQRSGGGYNFTDASGKPISARLFAQQTGTGFNTLLKSMAAHGDKGAADVLKNGGSSWAYKALTWD